MVILINPNACAGKASEKWNKIKRSLNKKICSAEIITLNGAGSKSVVENCINKGETEFVAAGGDGTINHLLNDIVSSATDQLEYIKLGAIGLGSSNDFHKPFDKNNGVNGIHCKINFKNIEKQDLCRLSWEDENGLFKSRFFLLNSSIGITAEANLLFNKPDRMLRFLKRKNTNTAIIYAALKTIFTYKNRKVKICTGGAEKQVSVTNLGIVKSPHFSGNFCYDSSYEPGNGKYNVHLIEGMPLFRLLTILYRLTKKRFSGYPGTSSCLTDKIAIKSNKTFAVEFDGEVIETKKAVYSIIPRAVNICK